MMTRGRKRERGAAAVEMAMVVGLLVMIAIGAFGYGMAFRSWFGVTAASREGARIGASAGSPPPPIAPSSKLPPPLSSPTR